MKVCIFSNQARSTALFWGTLIKIMSSMGYEVLIMVPEGAPLKDVQDLHDLGAGIEVLTYPLERRGVRIFQEMRTLRVLYQLLRDEQPQKLFITTIKPIIYGGLLLRFILGKGKKGFKPAAFACITGLGYVYEEENSAWKKFFRQGISFLFSLALQPMKKIFFQNAEDMDYFVSQGIISYAQKEKCVLTQGTGVNIRQFPFKPSYPSTPTFLLMARLLESKGIHDFVVAARILKGTYPEARFQVLGPEEEGVGAITLEQMQSWHEEGSIEYLGMASDVRPHIEAASVMVLPSWREGTPCAILEGMSMGRAAVVSDVPGCRQVVQEGSNGFLVPVKDPLALAQGLERFLLAPHLIPYMGAKGRKKAEKYFNAEHVAHSLMQHMDI